MAQREYLFGWMAVAVVSVVALLLTHHRWHAGFLAAALVVLHADFVCGILMAAKAPQLGPAETEFDAEPDSESRAISSDEGDELAA